MTKHKCAVLPILLRMEDMHVPIVIYVESFINLQLQSYSTYPPENIVLRANITDLVNGPAVHSRANSCYVIVITSRSLVSTREKYVFLSLQYEPHIISLISNAHNLV